MGKAYETWDEIVGTDLKSHFDAALGRRVRNPLTFQKKPWAEMTTCVGAAGQNERTHERH